MVGRKVKGSFLTRLSLRCLCNSHVDKSSWQLVRQVISELEAIGSLLGVGTKQVIFNTMGLDELIQKEDRKEKCRRLRLGEHKTEN